MWYNYYTARGPRRSQLCMALGEGGKEWGGGGSGGQGRERGTGFHHPKQGGGERGGGEGGREGTEEREISKTLFYKDCSLGSFKT